MEIFSVLYYFILTMDKKSFMPKSSLTFEAISQLHRAGHLNEAKKGYLKLLRINSCDANSLHGLGILLIQQKKPIEAISYLKKAIAQQPQNPVIQLHLANALKIQGLFDEAIQVLQKTISAHPNYIPALNNLGTIFYEKEQWQTAIDAYRLAIFKEPTFMDAYYNLGLAYAKQKNFKEAIQTYRILLENLPDHFAARFLLASTLMQEGHIADAILEFLVIESTHAFHFETQTNLATCYLKQGRLNEAKMHYLKAQNLRPADCQILYNLGVIHLQQGQIDAAIQYYQKAVAIDQNIFATHYNLGIAFLAKHHIPYALIHFKEALRIEPNNQAVAYTINRLSAQIPMLAAPVEYVKSLFDSYADHYDLHLIKTLDYQLPKLLTECLSLSLAKKLDILDIGCGTGLCGTLLKPYAERLIGIDLSEKMLEKANDKQCYDQLIAADFLEFLTDKYTCYDLVIAADVLVYRGELESVFKKVYQALKPAGVFAFNTEINTETDFMMNPSGRFSHHKNYINNLVKKMCFKIISCKTVKTRLHNKDDLYGYLYILERN